MAILELHGLKVVPPPDLDDGESLWICRGGATTVVRWGREWGFGQGSRGHGRRRQAALPVVASSSGKILNSVS